MFLLVRWCYGNYLRVRGEYAYDTPHHAAPSELPPRARRIRLGGATAPAGAGTTSACAENTILRR